MKEYYRQSYAKNREQLLQYQKDYYEKNKDMVKAKQAAYRAKKRKSSDRKEKTLEEVLAQREYNRIYYRENIERITEMKKKYRDENKDIIKIKRIQKEIENERKQKGIY